MFADQKDKLFCEIAADLGFVSNEQVSRMLEEQGVDRAIGVNSPIGEYLFKANILTKEQIGQILKVQGKLEQAGTPMNQPNSSNGEVVATPTPQDESSDQTSAWLVINPLVFFYNCYAGTFNLLYANNEFSTWLWIGIAVVINVLILASYPEMIRTKAPHLSNGVIVGSLMVILLAGCGWGYMSGNPYTNKLLDYHNSYFVGSYNEAILTQHNSIIEVLQKKNEDDSEFLNLIKYKVSPKFANLIDAANKVEPPYPMQKTHEEYISLLKQYKAVIDDLIKSTETQNILSIKASFAELKSTTDRLEALSATEKNICQANGMEFK
ncbi:MAG TPA: hypothetical protein PK263_06220 [bacterium]|nr:hypothetical protein [bacterium]